jgi:pyridoxal biosynthesis lyase PdxS
MMKTYEFEIRAVVSKRVTIDAKNLEEANRKMHPGAAMMLDYGEPPTQESLVWYHIGTRGV